MPSLGSLYWTIRGDTSQLDKDAQRSAQQLGTQLQKQGRQATAALTVPLVAFAAAGSKAFQDINKGLREVVTLTGQAGAEADATFDSFREQVQGLSSELGVAQTELVDGLYSALSAGVPQDNVFNFLETATKAGIAGVATTEEAVDGITSAINAFGLEFTEADRVADVFFSAVRNGKTTLSELSSNIGKIAPIANLVGVSVEEVGAALSTLTANGLATSEAGTQIRAALTALTRPSEELVAIFNDLGFASAQSAIEQEGLQFALQAVFDSANGDVGALTALLGTQEAVGATALIAGSAQEKFASDLEAAANSAGAAALAFDQIDEARNIERALNDIRNLAIEIGANLAPAVQGAAAVLAQIVAVLERIPTGLLTAFGAAVAAIGPAQVLLGRFLESGTTLATLGPRIGAALTTAFGPVGLAAVAIGAVTAAVFTFRNAAAEAEERATTYADAVAGVDGANTSLKEALDRVNPSIDDQTAAFEAATGAGAGFLALVDEVATREKGFFGGFDSDTSLIDSLGDLGITGDDLGAIAVGDATIDQLQRYEAALAALERQGLSSEAGERGLAISLDATAKAAALAAERSDALARAQLELALDAGLISQDEANQIGTRAELAGQTGALAEETERYFLAQESLTDALRASEEYYGSDIFGELNTQTQQMVETTSTLGAILSVQLPADINAFIQASAAGAQAGRAAFDNALNDIGLELDTALTGVLDIDTSNGVNDVQDAINNITGAVDSAGDSLQILQDQADAIAKLRELGPELETSFDSLIKRIASGEGNGLLDNIIGDEFDGGAQLAELEAELNSAEALAIELKLEAGEGETEAFNTAFVDSFTAAASDGLKEFTDEIAAAEPEIMAELNREEIDNEFDEIVKRIEDANPFLTVQVQYVDGFGIAVPNPDGTPNLTGEIPGFMFGGQVPPNTVARVGEVRPELIQTDAAGRAFILPNTGALQETADGSSGGINIENVSITEAEASGDPGTDLARALYLRGF